MVVWHPVCCFPAGHRVFPGLPSQDTTPGNNQLPAQELKTASSAGLQDRLEAGALFGTGWRTSGQPHLGAVMVQQKGKTGTGSLVCASPALFYCNINQVPPKEEPPGQSSPWNLLSRRINKWHPSCTGHLCGSSAGFWRQCQSQRQFITWNHLYTTYMVPTSLLLFPSSSPEHCSLKMAHPLLLYSVVNGFWTSKRGEKTPSLQHAVKYYAATLLKNTYKTRC